jgi:hypothetical protein
MRDNQRDSEHCDDSGMQQHSVTLGRMKAEKLKENQKENRNAKKKSGKPNQEPNQRPLPPLFPHLQQCYHYTIYLGTISLLPTPKFLLLLNYY